MQTKCIWYVEKKNPKWIERVNFEMYSSCMQRVLAPHKILFLYGASIPASVISWQPARTKVLLPPPEHLAFWKAGGPFTGTKIMWNMLGGRRQAKAADLRGCKGGGQPGLAAREATRNQVQNLNLQWIQCKALQHIAAMSIHPSQKWWCLWKGQSHRENTKGCCDEWKSWAASWDLQRFGSRNSFFFFSKPLPYVPREIQNKLCKRSLPALVDPQGPEQVLTLPWFTAIRWQEPSSPMCLPLTGNTTDDRNHAFMFLLIK